MPSTIDNATARAQLSYGRKPADGKGFFYYYVKDLPEGVQQRTNVALEECETSFTDLRGVNEPFTLLRNGFAVETLRNSVQCSWNDSDQVKRKFYPEIEAVIKRATGATRVLIFDHTVRKGSTKHEASKVLGKSVPGSNEPVQRAHVDYTLYSGPNRLKQLMPDEAETLQQSPYAVIQAWKPLKGPVQDSPLAICDASTVAQDDLITATVHFADRVGQTYLLAHNPDQRWYYAKGMQTDEIYLFVGYASSNDGRARFTPHASFEDSDAPPDAPQRESIEIRAYVFWEHASQQ